MTSHVVGRTDLYLQRAVFVGGASVKKKGRERTSEKIVQFMLLVLTLPPCSVLV